VRGWYQAVYSDIFRGRRVLEIGSGMGIDGIHFIREGAIWHFTDILPSNLTLIRRTLGAFNLDCEGMTLIESLASLDGMQTTEPRVPVD
jgi:predicted nicotinamide N-methyase